MIEDVDGIFNNRVVAEHKRQPKRSMIIENLNTRMRIRRSDDIADWSRAVDRAERPDFPDRTELMRIMKNMRIDGHLNGILKVIKNKVRAKDFWIVDKEGEVDEEATHKFKSQWFNRYLDWSVESPFYGFTLIQLNDLIDGVFKDMKMVPRENVVPEFHFVKEDTNTFSATSSGWDYESPQLKNWFVLLGKDKDLGLFNDIAPHAISKKHMFSALWQFIEIFGMPIRIGKTNTDDNKQRQQMTDMMKNMGRAAWAVIDEEDKIEFAEKITGGADVFLDSIKVSNSEIAKGMVGVSGIFEDKSFAGTADVQSEILDEIISSFCQQAEFDVNDDLLPRMQKQGSMVDRFFLWKSKDTMTSIQKGEMIALLSPWFNFKPEEVEKEIGIAIDSVAVSPEVKQDISARIKALHSTFDIKLPSKNKEDE